ncbi:CIA30 family protein [Candidatus Pseudothioglobus singularis]|nr:CIA30 family protein [Candidatus Pseudothioglobus singularis]MDC3216534.1 CIA30 family protein [Candidatus Pseudothioglobus singularis]
MKQFTAFILLSFIATVSLAQNDLVFPIQEGAVSDWKYVSDRVMGGVSEGNVYLEKDGDTSFARLTGDVSTRNNGGFIQLRSAVSLFKKPKMFQLIHDANKGGQELQGVRLNVRGNGETYHVMIRTYFTWRPSDYYYHTFEAGPDWTKVEMPFSAFKRSTSKTSKMDINDIRDFGIVAYGRDFKSDVSVSEVSFYF